MSKVTVIFHRADFDGHFSGAVCKKFLPDAEMIGWDYGDPLIPFPEEGCLYIVDLSPSCLKEPLSDEQVPRLVWIDHHKSSILQFGEQIQGYRIDGVAACRLCWQWFMRDFYTGGLGWALPKLEDYVMRRVHEPLALTLAGEYDVWNLGDDRALPLQFGLTAKRIAFDNGMLSMLDVPEETDITGNWIHPGDAEVNTIASEGRSAMLWQREFASQVMRERSYVRNWDGLNVAIMNSSHARNSMWFPEDEIPENAEALMCWRYDGKVVHFSLYHAPGFEKYDLSKIASAYGGGGHAGACGFTLPLDKAMRVIK